MADIENAAPDQEFLEDGTTPNPAYKKPDADGGEEGKDDVPDKKDDIEGDEPDVPVRRSALNSQNIINRQKKTIKNLRDKSDDDEEEDNTSEGDDTKLTPQAHSAVSDEVNKQLQPILANAVSRADEEELTDLYRDEPEAKKLDKTIRKYMKTKGWEGVPPLTIYRSLAFEDAQIQGARKKRIADVEANQSRGGGNEFRPTETTDESGIPTIEEQNKMTPEQFAKFTTDVKAGKYLNKQ